jgi:hypothetical protein
MKGRRLLHASASDGILDGVVHLKPGQQAGDRQDPEHGGLRTGQGKAAAPAANLLTALDKHAEAGTVDEGQPGEVNDGSRLRLPPDVAEVGLQYWRAQEIQFSAQAHDGDVVATVG